MSHLDPPPQVSIFNWIWLKWFNNLYSYIKENILTDFRYEVARGNVTGATTWNKWGYNADIDTGTETVWSVGGTFARMTSADTINIVSSNSVDNQAGTGARSVIIYGVDENYAAQTEVLSMHATDGTIAVTTVNQWLGINRIAVYLCGTGGVNAGTISATVTTGGAAQAEIPIGKGSTQHAFFFVQAGHTALMDWAWINVIKTSGGTKPEVITNAWVTSLVSGSKYDVMTDYMDVAIENVHEYNPSQPFVVGEKSLIEFQTTTDTDNTAVSIRFSLIEIAN